MRAKVPSWLAKHTKLPSWVAKSGENVLYVPFFFSFRPCPSKSLCTPLSVTDRLLKWENIEKQTDAHWFLSLHGICGHYEKYKRSPALSFKLK